MVRQMKPYIDCINVDITSLLAWISETPISLFRLPPDNFDANFVLQQHVDHLRYQTGDLVSPVECIGSFTNKTSSVRTERLMHFSVQHREQGSLVLRE